MAYREKIAERFHTMFSVPIQAVDIFSLEARSKKREDPVLNKEKQPISKDETTLVDKLEGARVHKRNRTGKGEKKKFVSRMQVQANVLGLSSFEPIAEEGVQKKGIQDYSRDGDGGYL